MSGTPVSTVTEMLINILLGCFSLVTLSWVLVGVQTFINDYRNEKRNQAREKRDEEYHVARMKEYK